MQVFLLSLNINNCSEYRVNKIVKMKRLYDHAAAGIIRTNMVSVLIFKTIQSVSQIPLFPLSTPPALPPNSWMFLALSQTPLSPCIQLTPSPLYVLNSTLLTITFITISTIAKQRKGSEQKPQHRKTVSKLVAILQPLARVDLSVCTSGCFC